MEKNYTVYCVSSRKSLKVKFGQKILPIVVRVEFGHFFTGQKV